MPAVVPAIVTVALFAFITSWNEFLGALVMMSKAVDVHAAADPRRRPHRDQPRRHRLGHAPGRHHDLDHPVHPRLPAAAAVLRLGPPERSGQVSAVAIERPSPRGRCGTPDERPIPMTAQHARWHPAPMTVTTDRAERIARRAPSCPTDGAICRRASRCPPGTSRSSAASGPTASARTASARSPHGFDAAGRRREPRRTSASRRARRARYRALGACRRASSSRSSTPTSTSGSRRVGWELGRGAGRRSSPRMADEVDRARRGGAARRTAT